MCLVQLGKQVYLVESDLAMYRFIDQTNVEVDASEQGWKMYVYVHQAAGDEFDSVTDRWQDGKGSEQAAAARPLIVIVVIKHLIT